MRAEDQPVFIDTNVLIYAATGTGAERLKREKALALTREEVPHAVSVEVDAIEDRTVRASIYVETESQKGIVVGKGGGVVRSSVLAGESTAIIPCRYRSRAHASTRTAPWRG